MTIVRRSACFAWHPQPPPVPVPIPVNGGLFGVGRVGAVEEGEELVEGKRRVPR